VKILIGCERSAVVRDAFRARGHEAISCDLVETEGDAKWHIVGDVVDLAYKGDWDMLIAFPPCQYVAYVGARWWNKKARWKDEQQKALTLFYLLLKAPIEKIAIENPRGLPSKIIRKPDDVLEPYEFGHEETKRTYLWLKNLPPLMKTMIAVFPVKGSTEAKHGFDRSRTYSGIASAMAEQWGGAQ